MSQHSLAAVAASLASLVDYVDFLLVHSDCNATVGAVRGVASKVDAIINEEVS